jgi:hypothetical protein
VKERAMVFAQSRQCDEGRSGTAVPTSYASLVNSPDQFGDRRARDERIVNESAAAAVARPLHRAHARRI